MSNGFGLDSIMRNNSEGENRRKRLKIAKDAAAKHKIFVSALAKPIKLVTRKQHVDTIKNPIPDLLLPNPLEEEEIVERSER